MRSFLLPLFVLTVVSAVPGAAGAQVLINEFLYDAPDADTAQEYVELYNAGSSPVELAKWKINDGSNHTLNVPPKNGGTGSSVLPPGGFALLVDNAVDFLAAHPGLSGTVIDTVLSLPNAGGTVLLIDDSGGTADSVSYTKDQGANGDGNSLQRSGSAWVAASPTPGAANAVEAAAPPTPDAGSQAEPSDSPAPGSGQTVSSYVPPPVPQIFADAGGDRTVIVGADTEFDGRAYNRQKEPVDHVRFLWNFGDGSIAEGPSVVHHYAYPGRYAVVLDIAEHRDAASAQIIVTAEPAKLTFSVLSDGGVAIENRAGRNLDLSGWIVRQFGQMFILPEHSVILTGETMRIPQKTLKFWSSFQTELDYPNGVPVLHADEHSPESAPVPPAVAPAPVRTIAPAASPATAPVPETQTESAADTQVLPESAPPEAQAAAVVVAGGSYWWLGAFGLAALAAMAVVAVRRIKAGEWDIIEET